MKHGTKALKLLTLLFLYIPYVYIMFCSAKSQYLSKEKAQKNFPPSSDSSTPSKEEKIPPSKRGENIENNIEKENICMDEVGAGCKFFFSGHSLVILMA